MAVKLAKITDETPEQDGVIRKGWLSDIWTIPEDDDAPEYLVDCN